MIDIDGVRSLFAYSEWANERTVGALRSLTPEQLERPLGGSYANIKATFAHIVAAEWIWLERWHGTNPTAMPEWVSSSGLAELVDRLHAIAEARRGWLATVTASDLARTISSRSLSGQPLRMTLASAMVHVVNHSTYHRGQVATMLRQVGASAPSTDFSLYAIETGA